jgi:hypothetical protein
LPDVNAEAIYFAVAIPAMPSWLGSDAEIHFCRIGPIARTNWPDQRSALARLR